MEDETKMHTNRGMQYQMLGNKYESCNVNQSYLCYENAVYHYKKDGYADVPDTDIRIRECQIRMDRLRQQQQFAVVQTAIVILSYNNREITENCIESIRQHTCRHTYELIVVDNASADGVKEWLRKQEDICLIENDENMGFPYGCNQGISAAGKEMDIMLLNNDTIVPKDAIFWLRMGLYENEKIGAAGSVSNHAVNYQQVSEQFASVQQWMEFAEKNNVPLKHPYEKKSWLMGFALMIRRAALDSLVCSNQVQQQGNIREILDHRFSPGNFEDNDLGIRLLLSGYQLLLVKNSFIYHYGSKTFRERPQQYLQLILQNRTKMAEKYGMDFIPHFNLETALVDMIGQEKEKFRVLEIGCGLGAVLARIESMYPDADVLGLEENEFIARLAAGVTNVRNQSFLEDYDQEQHCFDFIIFDESLCRDQAQKMIQKAEHLLCADGRILLAVQNAQCVRQDGRDQEKSFCLDEIVELCMYSHLQIKVLNFRNAELSEDEEQKIQELCNTEHNSSDALYRIQKFILGVEKCR